MSSFFFNVILQLSGQTDTIWELIYTKWNTLTWEGYLYIIYTWLCKADCETGDNKLIRTSGNTTIFVAY